MKFILKISLVFVCILMGFIFQMIWYFPPSDENSIIIKAKQILKQGRNTDTVPTDNNNIDNNLDVDSIPDVESSSTIWHAYDPVLVNAMKSNDVGSNSCPSFKSATKPYPKKFSDQYKLWPNLQSSFDLKYGGK